MALVEHVVVDSGGFIRNAPIKDIGSKVYTTYEVVNEIKDKSTRQRLQVLPYELKFREPSSDSLRLVSEFSKKTGDYRNLSAVDIRVLALVYELEKENCGTDHINLVPKRNITWQTTKKHLENPTEIAGFYIGKKGKEQSVGSSTQTETAEEVTKGVEGLNVSSEKAVNTDRDSCINIITADETTNDVVNPAVETVDIEVKNIDSSDVKVTVDKSVKYTEIEEKHENIENKEKNESTESEEKDSDIENTKKVTFLEEGDVLQEGNFEADSDDEEEAESESESSDEDGWITPSNIKQVKKQMGDVNTETGHVKVGCITTDFCMQNVLIQMGLNVISVDGLLIKRAKNYVLRCYACFKISTDMTREFCHHCGNQTLQRVSMTVEDDGSIKYFLSSRKPLSTRGKKFSLPMPKGGKHANNPILCEDQKEAQQRSSKAAKVKYDVFDPNYLANSSPFAPTDTTSRSAQLGIRSKQGHRSRRNPNENRKSNGRRK